MKSNRQLALVTAALVQGAFAAGTPTTGDFARMDRAWSAQLESIQVLGAVPASAADIPYEFTVCTHGKPQMLESSGDFTGYAFEGWGVVSSSTTKEWENASTHCVGYSRWMNGKQVGKGLCKWTQASGDSAVGEFEFTPAGERHWTWLAGMGRLKGITGGGTFQEIFTAKTVDAGTAQGCRRDWGKYTMAQ
jgi:hypothetical protein